MNRRELLGISGSMLLHSAAAKSQGPHPSSLPTEDQHEKGQAWYGRPMRWAQLAFVEDDPGHYDQQFWLNYFARIHADAACLSAGGCIAFYPTKIPLHYRSRWLENRDTFGDLAKGCRDLGMNVLARTDAHAVHQDAADKHPEWITVDKNGHKRRHPSDPDFWITCALGSYNFEFMTAVHEEIMTLYRVDGIFTNRWAGSGMCFCESCRDQFRSYSGLDLPRTLNPQDKARRAYLQWHSERLFELWRLWDSRIKAINPQAAYLANAGGGALSELDMKTVGELAPTLFADRQGRRGLMPPWTNGKNGKEYRATLGRKAIAGIFSVGLEEEYRWKDSVQSPAEIRLWVADGIAHDLRPWFVKFNAKPEDRRWLPVVEDIYRWHHKNEHYLRNDRSLARVAMLYSQQTATFYGGEKAHELVEAPALGMYQALVEARIPFEMAHDHLLDREHLHPFKTLILPNIAALSDTQCRLLTDFVKNGGSLVATYQTSLFDEWGVKRKQFGLAKLFGADYVGAEDEGPMLNSYLRIAKARKGTSVHSLVHGLENAGRIINGVHRVGAKPLAPTYESPLTLVRSYPDLPMEEVFVADTPNSAAQMPAVFTQQLGQGRIVYFPFDLDRTFWEVLNPDHLLLLRNAFFWATNEHLPVSIAGPGLLDISIWQQKGSLTVHLVNLSNPMMMKGPIREVLPLPKQALTIQLPPEIRTVRSAKGLVADQTLPFRQEGNLVHLDVPSIDVHEVVALDL